MIRLGVIGCNNEGICIELVGDPFTMPEQGVSQATATLVASDVVSRLTSGDVSSEEALSSLLALRSSFTGDVGADNLTAEFNMIADQSLSLVLSTSGDDRMIETNPERTLELLESGAEIMTGSNVSVETLASFKEVASKLINFQLFGSLAGDGASSGSGRRRKRSVSSVASYLSEITSNMAETWLTLVETALTSSNTAEQIASSQRSILSTVSSTMKGLCRGVATAGDDGLAASGSSVNLWVGQVTNRTSQLDGGVMVDLGSQLAGQYGGSWGCGEGAAGSCQGVCVAVANWDADNFTPLSDLLQSYILMSKRMSPIVQVKLYDQLCVKESACFNSTSSDLTPTTNLNQPIKITISSNKTDVWGAECRIYDGTNWINDACTTSNGTNAGDVTCSCTKLGHAISVFKNGVIAADTADTSRQRRLSFAITQDFSTYVTNETRDQFVDSISGQLATKLDVGVARISGVNLEEGSIVTSLTLSESGNGAGATLDEAVSTLENNVGEGTLGLQSDSGVDLTVSSSSLVVSEVTAATTTTVSSNSQQPTSNSDASPPATTAKDTKDNLGLIIGASVGGAVLLILIVVGVCYLSKRNRRKSVEPMTPEPGMAGAYPFHVTVKPSADATNISATLRDKLYSDMSLELPPPAQIAVPNDNGEGVKTEPAQIMVEEEEPTDLDSTLNPSSTIRSQPELNDVDAPADQQQGGGESEVQITTEL